MVLRRIVDRRPQRMGAAFKAASANRHRFDDEGRGYPSVLREIVASARHAGTEIGAQALCRAASHLGFNAREPAGADPTERWLRIAAFAGELPRFGSRTTLDSTLVVETLRRRASIEN